MYFWSSERFIQVFISFERVLNKHILKVGWNLSFLNYQVKIERFIKQLLRLKFNLIIHFLTKINFSCLICRNKVDSQFSTVIVFTDYWKLNQIIKHVSQSLGCKEASANERMFWWIPKRIIFLLKLGDNASFKILFRHILNNVIPV